MAIRRTAAAFVYTSESIHPIRNGYVEYDGSDGTIISVGQCEDPSSEEEFHDGALVPGFVNAHCHVELSHLHKKWFLSEDSLVNLLCWRKNMLSCQFYFSL